MADVDHRKSLQILHKRTGRDKVIIIRDKFRMHTRFFTARHDFFQFSILLDAQGDRDLIQRIERQNRIQIVNFADHAHSLIFFAPLLMVIQNTADFIAPLRIDIHTVNKSFRCPAVTDQKQMLLVISRIDRSAIRRIFRIRISAKRLMPKNKNTIGREKLWKYSFLPPR